MFELERDLKDWIESKMTSVHPQLSDRADDFRGLYHLTFTSGGVREQATLVPSLCSSVDLALEFFKIKFLQYLETKEIKYLQWRRYPTIEKIIQYDPFDGRSHEYFYVSCRCSIAGY